MISLFYFYFIVLLVDGPLRYQMEEARVGRSSRRFRGYSPRGPGVVELLAVPRG